MNILTTRFGKDQKLTPQQILANAMQVADEISTVVVIGHMKDGGMSLGVSAAEGGTLQVLGMLISALLHHERQQFQPRE